jgi:hypothetical protein
MSNILEYFTSLCTHYHKILNKLLTSTKYRCQIPVTALYPDMNYLKLDSVIMTVIGY